MFRAFLREKVRLKTFSKLFFSKIGQDHTLWSWGAMINEGKDNIYIFEESSIRTKQEITDTQLLIDEFWTGITSTGVSHSL